jgi:hypothetical protein
MPALFRYKFSKNFANNYGNELSEKTTIEFETKNIFLTVSFQSNRQKVEKKLKNVFKNSKEAKLIKISPKFSIVFRFIISFSKPSIKNNSEFTFK